MQTGGMMSGGRYGLRVCVVLVLVALSWQSLNVIRAARLDSSRGDLERGRELLSDDAAFSQGLARQALIEEDGGRAEGFAEDAIRLFPFRGGAWLDLAEARLRQGDRTGVLNATRKAAMLAPTKGKWRWRAAILLLQAGWVKEATSELAAVARVDHSRRHRAYDLAWSVFSDPELVLGKIVPDNDRSRLDYLAYLVGKRRVAPALAVWRTAKGSASRRQRLSFVDFLLAHGAIEEAWEGWVEAFPGARIGAVHNGQFRRDPAGQGFGWRIGKPEGARIRFGAVSGSRRRGLEVWFEGGTPTFDHSHQVVRVAGSTPYRFSAEASWEDITSASPPRLYVDGYQGCAGLGIESVGLRGSGAGWVSVDFVTPPGCKAVVVGLRRIRTPKLDRNITGRVWLYKVELQPQAGAGIVRERPPRLDTGTTDDSALRLWSWLGGQQALAAGGGQQSYGPRRRVMEVVS